MAKREFILYGEVTEDGSEREIARIPAGATKQFLTTQQKGEYADAVERGTNFSRVLTVDDTPAPALEHSTPGLEGGGPIEEEEEPERRGRRKVGADR